MTSETRYSVGELARRAGIEPRTVREYVRAKIIKKAAPRGPATSYPASDLVRLRAARHLISAERINLPAIAARFAKMTPAQIEALLPPAAPAPAPAPAPASASAAAPASASAAALGEAWARVELFPGLELLMRAGVSPFIERIAREIRDRYAVAK